MAWPNSEYLYFTLPGVIDILLSAEGLVCALVFLFLTLAIFYGAFYRSAHKAQVPKIKILALLTVSLFNLLVVVPCVFIFAKPLESIVLALWWMLSFVPFIFSSLFFIVLIVGFVVLRKWRNFPMTEERPLRSYLKLSIAFEALYLVGCPVLVVFPTYIYTYVIT
ncbi:MAG: hypothetical protein LBC35_00995 [Coriobacteriales bacterium]|jgi:uncharacterized membrane protein YhaH (DUF805 family)|nr:hypothetical protein [Coriobacteriales bacterium]